MCNDTSISVRVSVCATETTMTWHAGLKFFSISNSLSQHSRSARDTGSHVMLQPVGNSCENSGTLSEGL